MKSDDELRKQFKITIDDNLVTATFLVEETNPDDNTRTTKLFLEDLEKAAKSQSDKQFNLLADLSPIGTGNYVTNESKKLYSQTKAFDNFSRIAVVSKSLIIKVLVVSISTLTGKFDNVKWFDNKEKAVDWLNKADS